MNIQIKRFSELSIFELYDILQLRNEVFVVEQNCIYQDCDSCDEYAWHMFAYDEHTKALICTMRILDRGQTFPTTAFGRVAVRKAYRGRGIAGQMLRKALDFTENQLKACKVTIAAQTYLKDFYESLGFTICSEVYVEDGIPHMDMVFKK